LMNPKPRSAFHIFKLPVAIALYSPSPSGRRFSTSAKEAHALNSVAPLATILNDVPTFSVGGAFLKLHCLFASDADQETYEWTFIVVQMTCPGGHSHRLIYHFPDPPMERLRSEGCAYWPAIARQIALGLFPLRLQPRLARQPLGFQAFEVFLKFRSGLAVRYCLPRRQRVESPSIGLVRDLLLS
jgi:hypothetical protein